MTDDILTDEEMGVSGDDDILTDEQMDAGAHTDFGSKIRSAILPDFMNRYIEAKNKQLSEMEAKNASTGADLLKNPNGTYAKDAFGTELNPDAVHKIQDRSSMIGMGMLGPVGATKFAAGAEALAAKAIPAAENAIYNAGGVAQKGSDLLSRLAEGTKNTGIFDNVTLGGLFGGPKGAALMVGKNVAKKYIPGVAAQGAEGLAGGLKEASRIIGDFEKPISNMSASVGSNLGRAFPQVSSLLDPKSKDKTNEPIVSQKSAREMYVEGN